MFLDDEAYGVWEWNASMLQNSYGGVQDRLAMRGTENGYASEGFSARQISEAYINVIYKGEPYDPKCDDRVASLPKDATWAPDGDEAFDDGSFIMHLDLGNHVRLIGWRTTSEYKPADLREILLPAAPFYKNLEDWVKATEQSWRLGAKVHGADNWWTEELEQAAILRWEHESAADSN